MSDFDYAVRTPEPQDDDFVGEIEGQLGWMTSTMYLTLTVSAGMTAL